jgi:hypothetical protein
MTADIIRPATSPGDSLLTAGWTCCACRATLSWDKTQPNQYSCTQCSNVYPVADGVPYLAVYGTHWRAKLRELLTFRDYWHKRSGRAAWNRTASPAKLMKPGKPLETLPANFGTP